MKLVELLAKEVSEWHDDTAYVFQDMSGTIYCTSKGKPKYKESWKEWNVSPSSIEMSANDSIYGVTLDVASDHAESVIDRAQWQAERDRQKGGEWKRHRGGKCPVPAGTKVSTRHRNGEVVDVHFHTATTSAGQATMNTVWKHTGDQHDIMQYKIISQPQAEEVEMIKVDPVVAANVEAFNGQWQIGRVDGPLVWRDTVNELDAYIEEFTREREALINRLALEGFALLPAMTAVMGVADVDMSDWRNWKAGDIVECVTGEYTGVYTKGNQYEVEWVKEDCFSVYDDCGEKSSCDWFDHDAEGLKFISRP